MKYFCTCEEDKKLDYNWHKKFREVEVNEEEICMYCGHYAVRAKSIKDATLMTKIYISTGDYRNTYGKELTHFIENECSGFPLDVMKQTRKGDFEGQTYIRFWGYNN